MHPDINISDTRHAVVHILICALIQGSEEVASFSCPAPLPRNSSISSGLGGAHRPRLCGSARLVLFHRGTTRGPPTLGQTGWSLRFRGLSEALADIRVSWDST